MLLLLKTCQRLCFVLRMNLKFSLCDALPAQPSKRFSVHHPPHTLQTTQPCPLNASRALCLECFLQALPVAGAFLVLQASAYMSTPQQDLLYSIPPPPIITAPCLFPARHPPSTSNLHLFHLPVYSLVYCLSSSTSANYMEVLSVCSSLDPQAPSPGSSKNKCLFSEQMPETMRRHFTCIISKAETIVPIQQTEEIVFLLLR